MIGERVNVLACEKEWNGKIEKNHVETKAFQLSKTNDPVFGFTSPEWVHGHDQVPMCLCPGMTKPSMRQEKKKCVIVLAPIRTPKDSVR